jgi:zinc protease
MLRTARAAGLALLLATAAAAPFALPAPARAADVPPIQFKSRTLPNGLKVYSSLDRTTPNVTVQVWYGRSKDDPEAVPASLTCSST